MQVGEEKKWGGLLVKVQPGEVLTIGPIKISLASQKDRSGKYQVPKATKIRIQAPKDLKVEKAFDPALVEQFL